jgi:tRNA nucleotidyltransferase/poly(A) polymerase
MDCGLGVLCAVCCVLCAVCYVQLRHLFRHVVELPRNTVKLTHAGEVLELTCFRGISRAASMFSVAMDAQQRDFTVNSLYYDPRSGQVLDFVGGVPDARQRTLRLTEGSGAPLRQDPLRVLRAVRFATVLQLRLTPDTARALKEHAQLCSVQQGKYRTALLAAAQNCTALLAAAQCR